MTLPKRRHAPPVEPVTPEQWQTAVDAASLCLAIDSCYQYGLLTGPPINVPRALEILERGKALGYAPARGAAAMTLETLPPEDPAIERAIQETAERMWAAAGDDPTPAVLLAAIGRLAVWVFSEVEGPDTFVQQTLSEWLAAVSNDAWVTRQEGR